MFKTDKFLPAKKEAQKLLGKDCVLTDDFALALHSYDCGLGRTRPDAVLKINDAAKLPALIKILNKHAVPFTARAAATNHVGGCVALKGGVILNLYSLNKILEINTEESYAEVEPCVVNADLQYELAKRGYYYAPDPASEKICTLGGNVALNAGGARGLKYGSTADHILRLEFILPDGEVFVLDRADHGPDLAGLITGSEGTLGLISKIRVKIFPKDFHVKTILVTFDSIEKAVTAVSAIRAEGIMPLCVEAMDKITTQTVEAFAKCGYPTDCGALLLIETDGSEKEAAAQIKKIEAVCKKHGSLKIISAKTEEQRDALWKGRRGGYAAMARLAPNVFVEDGTVPVSKLPEALRKTREICADNDLTAGLFFHAADGNLHPNVVFDSRNKNKTNIVREAGKDMLDICIEMGGTISGEHGVGIEKRAAMARMYSPAELDVFRKIKHSLDPQNISNPDKVIPVVKENSRLFERAMPPLIEPFASHLKNGGEIQICGSKTALSKNPELMPLETVKKLNKIIETDTANHTVTVEAGVKIKDLAKELKKQNLYLHVSDYDGTAGGLYSLGHDKNFNALVTGVEVMDARGNIMRFGGKFVKNSAGYSMTRFLAGSRGAFMLVTKLILKVYREPSKTAGIKLPLPEKFEINKISADLKKALDFKNQFNPFIFGEDKND